MYLEWSIFALYEICPIQPTIEVTPNSFKLTLPNLNAAQRNAPPTLIAERPITAQMQVVLDYLSAHGEISEAELQALLGVKRTRAYLLAKEMLDASLIKAAGRGKQKKYTLI